MVGRGVHPEEDFDDAKSPVAILLKILLPSSAPFALWFVSSQLLKLAEPISERVLNYVKLPNYHEQMGFQHRVNDDLQFVY
jgi:hypothetical protein